MRQENMMPSFASHEKTESAKKTNEEGKYLKNIFPLSSFCRLGMRESEQV